MKTIQNVLILFLSLAVLTACEEDPKDNPVLKEAFKIHNEAMAIHDEIMPQMKDLNDTKKAVQQAMNQIQIRAEEMDTESFSALQAAMSSLVAADEGMRDWMANISEVPGFAHDHNHGGHDHGDHEDHDHGDHEDHDHAEHEGHDHDHDHGPAPKLTPEQILEVQKTHKADILKLKEDMEAAMTGAKQVLSAMTTTEELNVE
jgi:hypothetical protein